MDVVGRCVDVLMHAHGEWGNRVTEALADTCLLAHQELEHSQQVDHCEEPLGVVELRKQEV